MEQFKKTPRPKYILTKLHNNKYKYQITTPTNKKIKFGDSSYQDYTIHKDPYRKQRYILRHQTQENWHDLTTKGFWSRWLLWNKTSITKSIHDIQARFNITIIRRK